MIPLDYNDLKEGFQFTRDVKIAENQERLENAEFERMCARLYARQWAARLRAGDPERVRKNKRRWREEHRELVRLQEKARSLRRRRGEKPEPYLNVCCVCGGTWESPRSAMYCSRMCKERRYRSRRATSPSVGQRIIRHLRERPGATSTEVSACLGLKRNTVQMWLGRARRVGVVLSTGGPRNLKWFLGPLGSPTGVGEFTLRAARGELMVIRLGERRTEEG